jgi:glucose-6-phosphate 1-epimerase
MNDASSIVELDRRHGIGNLARVVEGNNGLAKVVVTTAAARGEIYLHGAHVTSWMPNGAQEVLFLSSQSRWEDGRAIRGGVPICFPWFADRTGDPRAPAHGFVRTKSWHLESITQCGDALTVTMQTASDDNTRKWWPADFRLVHRATFGPELTQELELHNMGTAPLRFEEALHAYFRVGSFQNVRLLGLDGVTYLDKPDENREKRQLGPISITAETDRVYLNTTNAIELEDRALNRRIRVTKDNSFTTVVWNPWVAKAKAMSDFGDNEWMQMVCIETSNVAGFAVDLHPGKVHSMKAMMGVFDL